MGYEVDGPNLGTLAAGADLSAKQFYLVKAGSGGAVLAGAGERCLGPLRNAPKQTEAADIRIDDVGKVIYGGTVAIGDELTSDGNGKAIASSLSTDYVIGIALLAGAAGDIGSVHLSPRGATSTSSASVLSIPIKLSDIANGTIWGPYTPGFAGKVKKVSFTVTDPATTSAKGSTLNVDIGTTPTTGGVLVLTSANCTPLGNTVDASAITAANSFGATDSIKVVAASTTAFVEGTGMLEIVLG